MEPTTDTNTAIAVMQRDLGYVRATVDETKLAIRDVLKEIRDSYATKAELGTVRDDLKTLKSQIYAIAGVIIVSVVAAWLKIVLG